MLVEAKELCKDYGNGFALKNISFSISERGIYGFLGRSKAGKTALAGLLCGADEADSGSLLYKEKEMLSLDKVRCEIKKKVAYVPNKSFFDASMTVMESMDFVGKAKKIETEKRFKQIKEALELVGLSNKTERLVSDLGLSEEKRLGIAAALLGNPDVVIMDEPLRYHNENQVKEIKELIELLGGRKVLIILSSHSDEIEELCDYVGILRDGELVFFDRIDTTLKALSAKGFGGLFELLEAFSEKTTEVE